MQKFFVLFCPPIAFFTRFNCTKFNPKFLSYEFTYTYYLLYTIPTFRHKFSGKLLYLYKMSS